MIDITKQGRNTWIEFAMPDTPEQRVRVNLTFLASNWRCLYGQGCPGMFHEDATHIAPDVACCAHGFVPADWDEIKRIDRDIELLTDEDWDVELSTAVETYYHGWYTHDRFAITKERKLNSANSVVHEGGCIFANRADGSVGKTGKIGCAWLHYGNRVNGGKGAITENSAEHHNFMPRVCWMVPISFGYDKDGTMIVDAWSTLEWTRDSNVQDGEFDSEASHWWCIDSEEAYSGPKRVVESMEVELRDLLGDKAYELVRTEIDRMGDAIAPMPASPAGRQLLPMLPRQTIESQVGDRKPIRP